MRHTEVEISYVLELDQLTWWRGLGQSRLIYSHCVRIDTGGGERNC